MAVASGSAAAVVGAAPVAAGVAPAGSSSPATLAIVRPTASAAAVAFHVPFTSASLLPAFRRPGRNPVLGQAKASQTVKATTEPARRRRYPRCTAPPGRVDLL